MDFAGAAGVDGDIADLYCLHRALADAAKDGLLRVNPSAGAMSLPRERPALQFWTSADVAAFLIWLEFR